MMEAPEVADCGVMAVMLLTDAPRQEVERQARSRGYRTGRGMPNWAVIALAADHGLVFAPGLTRVYHGLTSVRVIAREHVEAQTRYGLVFAEDHVMPIRDGVVLNAAGYGDAPVLFTSVLHRRPA